MANAEHEQHLITRVTSKEWVASPIAFLLGRIILVSFNGLILYLILMIFIPGLRSAGEALLFTGVFAALVTPLVRSSDNSKRRVAFERLTGRVNDAVTDLTDSQSNHLSVEQFRQLVLTGNPHSLSVNGVPGLDLVVIKQRTAVEVQGAKPLAPGQPPTTVSFEWHVVVNVTVPEYGISSFDRLLSAATATAD